MDTWEAFERIVKIAGISGGAAAAVGVFIQLQEINYREQQRKIEDWQSSVVYQIIEEGKDLGLKRISELYVNEAQKIPISLPRETLTDVQLRLVLMRLIQNRVIVESEGQYRINNNESTPELMFDFTQYFNTLAKHMNSARAVFSKTFTPISLEQLRSKIIAAGGDAKFTTDNFDVLLTQIQNGGVASMMSDGRIISRVRVETLVETPPPPPPPLPSSKRR